MANTSVSLGAHWESFIAGLVAEGRYASASEVVRAGLRRLEEDEQRLERLRTLIREGEESGIAGPLDMDDVIARGMERWNARHG
ncbi:type II toxin-antitoxin system ParD family antitoxin [Paracoccus sp. S-4012]|uniref:type II toxin-antitoxin system ParD family antitoxin n=1 Tax=Paracoccus sp. S-4012 TaxID=2665648 RepID=UPI0018A1CDAA|nr:type II toxin-antitoxin system ParD family antitoxin [Paracoccus sp. S-4012]